MHYRSSILLYNSSEKEIVLHIEPWGGQIPMPIGGKFLVVAQSKQAGEFEIVYLEDAIMIYGWTGSIVNVYCDGQEIF